MLAGLAAERAFAQYDKVAALGSDSSLTPIGGPASSPPISDVPYDLPDFRPTGALNDRLPAWLRFGVEERLRLETANNSSYVLSRLRVGMALQPASWFKLVAQTQDARSFFQPPPFGPPNNVRWDLKLAYVQFGDVEKHPVTLTLGRQLIDYNNTIIGNSEWRNQARSFDAVVANVHANRFRAALFAASAVSPMLNGISHRQHGNNIYGAYGWITRIVPKSSIEPFVLWRVAPSVPVEAGAVKSGRLDERAYGIRVRGSSLSNFDYRYEVAYERGSAGPNRLAAWATTAGLGYSMHSVAWTPRLFTGYDYASGDRNARDGRHGAFDTMYATAHDRFGVTDQFGWQNIKSWRGGATITPHPRWSWTAQYLNLWLASATDAAYNSSGAPMFRDSTGRSGVHIGEEFDSYTWYEVNRQIHVGAGAGRLLAGEFMAKAGRRGSYTYPYVVVEILDGRRVR